MNKIKYIYCENQINKLWDTYIHLENKPSVNKFLTEKYKKYKHKDYNKLAQNNTSKFIYFIKQAKEYFLSADNCPILIKPLLIYYGMMSLIKALVLTKDPYYPKLTSVLRHGISTRKLKKNNYSFHNDEIKIQKEGLLPLFYNTVTNNDSTEIQNNKYIIKDLLSHIPEIHDSYYNLFNQKLIYPIHIDKQLLDSTIEFSVSKKILNHYNNDINLLLLELNNQNRPYFINKKNSNFQLLTFEWRGNIKNPIEYENFFNHPLIIQDYKGKYYLRIINNNISKLPQIIINYLLMYNLGILCRYDTELWGEIVFSFSSEDILIINDLINLSLSMFPNLILNNLFEEKIIFLNNS